MLTKEASLNRFPDAIGRCFLRQHDNLKHSKHNVIVFMQKKVNPINSLLLSQYFYMKGFIAVFILLLSLFASCKTGSKNSVEKIMIAQRNIMPSDSIIQKQKKGIDVFASGDIPSSWSLEIDFDKLVSFSSADGIKIKVLPNFSKKEITEKAEIYYLQTDPGPMTIELFTTPCSGKGEAYNKTVNVTIGKITYTGCGKYLYDHQLNDIWVMESINNIPQPSSSFSKGSPTMQFNLESNKMTGSDGCNNISSDIEIKGDRIKFSTFSSTKMACNNNISEKVFSGMISNKLVNYYMANGKLVLYLEDDSKVAFKRKSF